MDFWSWKKALIREIGKNGNPSKKLIYLKILPLMHYVMKIAYI